MKGQSIRCINVEKLTTITDYMVIVTGTSSTHIKALADAVVVKLKAANHSIVGIEGKMSSDWVLVDAGGVVVHFMLAPVRALYNLEDLWDFRSQTSASKADSEMEKVVAPKVSTKKPATRKKVGVKAKAIPRVKAKAPAKKRSTGKRTIVAKAPA